MSFTLLGILNAQAAGIGAAGDFHLLESTVLTTSATSVSFTGLDTYTDFKHLQIRYSAKSSTEGSPLYQRLSINETQGVNSHALYGNGSQVVSESASQIIFLYYDGSQIANTYGAGIVDVLDFSSTTKTKTIRAFSGTVGESGINNSRVALSSGLINSLSLTTSLKLESFFGNYVSGSRFSLYGIKG